MSMFQVERRQREAAKPKQLRKRGLLPMALVERSHETMLIQAPVEELRQAMAHVDGHGRMELQISGEGGSRRAIIKHVEHDPFKRELIHVTLQEVADEDTVKMDIPVVAIGHSELAEGSGVALQTVTDHLKVRGRVMDLPEHVEVDISNLGVGEHICAGDIPLPNGVELLTPADVMLFNMMLIREPSLETTTETEAETGELGASEETATGSEPAEEG